MTVPRFSIEAHVVDINGAPPTGGQSFTFHVQAYGDATVSGSPVTVSGTANTGWMAYDATKVATLKAAYGVATQDNIYNYRHDLLVATLILTPASGTVQKFTNLAGNIREDETGVVTAWTAKMFPNANPAIASCGFVVYYETASGSYPLIAGTTGNTPRAVILAEFNRRYLTQVQAAIPSPAALSQYILIHDDFRGGDNNFDNWRVGYDIIDRLGANTLAIPRGTPSGLFEPVEKELVDGCPRIRRISRVSYSQAASLPWYPAANGTTEAHDNALAAWALGEKAAIENAGWTVSDVSHHALEDEPGWYFPSVLDNLKTGTAGSSFGDGVRSELVRTQWLTSFRDYVAAQGFTAAQVKSGATDFSTVVPIGPEFQAGTIEQRRCYVLSVRWLAQMSSAFHGRLTDALQVQFPTIQTSIQWNHASGRVINPTGGGSTVGNGGIDWLEEAAVAGVTDLQPEDYNVGRNAYNTPHTVAKAAAAGKQGTISRGSSLLTPGASVTSPVNSTTTMTGAQLRKEISTVGHGAKNFTRYTFGPIHTQVDGYAEEMFRKPTLIDSIRTSNELIAAADAYVGPGQRLASAVGILLPISSELFDAGVSDLATSSWETSTVDYLLEAEALWTALAHDHIYADWLREEEMTAGVLAGYQVLYVTGPNIPAAAQSAIATWVNGGGVLVTVPGAGTKDQFNDALTTIASLGGLVSPARARQNCPSSSSLSRVFNITGIGGGDFARGIDANWRETITAAGTTEATFNADSAPAISNVVVGSGRRIHFSFFPAATYMVFDTTAYPATGTLLAEGFPALMRTWIARPVRTFSTVLPPVEVNQPLLDAPMLKAGTKVAVTLVNQSNTTPLTVTGRVRPGAAVAAMRLASTGAAVSFANTGDGATFGPVSVPVADVLLVDLAASATRPVRGLPW